MVSFLFRQTEPTLEEEPLCLPSHTVPGPLNPLPMQSSLLALWQSRSCDVGPWSPPELVEFHGCRLSPHLMVPTLASYQGRAYQMAPPFLFQLRTIADVRVN
jgi:hypothetical protein